MAPNLFFWNPGYATTFERRRSSFTRERDMRTIQSRKKPMKVLFSQRSESRGHSLVNVNADGLKVFVWVEKSWKQPFVALIPPSRPSTQRTKNSRRLASTSVDQKLPPLLFTLTSQKTWEGDRWFPALSPTPPLPFSSNQQTHQSINQSINHEPKIGSRKSVTCR